jgi:hypothetical protein
MLAPEPESRLVLPLALPQSIFTNRFAVFTADKCLILLATPAGFEPATFSLEGCCSIP